VLVPDEGPLGLKERPIAPQTAPADMALLGRIFREHLPFRDEVTRKLRERSLKVPVPSSKAWSN